MQLKAEIGDGANILTEAKAKSAASTFTRRLQQKYNAGHKKMRLIDTLRSGRCIVYNVIWLLATLCRAKLPMVPRRHDARAGRASGDRETQDGTNSDGGTVSTVNTIDRPSRILWQRHDRQLSKRWTVQPLNWSFNKEFLARIIAVTGRVLVRWLQRAIATRFGRRRKKHG